MKWDINRLSSIEDDTGQVLIKEGFDTDDLVSLIQECKEGGIHPLVCPGSDDDLFGFELAVLGDEVFELRGIMFRDGFKEPGSTSRVAGVMGGLMGMLISNRKVFVDQGQKGLRIMIAHNVPVHSLFRSLSDPLRGVPVYETGDRQPYSLLMVDPSQTHS